MNELPIHLQTRAWPEEIFVEPARLSTGLWGGTYGDIAAAYCADTFPKIKTFIHDHQLFTNTGAVYSANGKESVDAYPLIADAAYRGPEPMQYSYEGEAVRYKGRAYRLGPKVRFVARERTVEEWTSLLRRMYAFGGFFASGKTYAELLEEFESEEMISSNKRAAISAESSRADLPRTQQEMCEYLKHGGKCAHPQLELMLE